MPIVGKKQKSKSVPTHLQWFKSKDFKQGAYTIVTRTIDNEDWKTSTIVGELFKYNFKFPNTRELEDFASELWDYIRDGDHLLILVDESEKNKGAYGCYLDALPIPTTVGLELDWDCEDSTCVLKTPIEDIVEHLNDILPPALLPSKQSEDKESKSKSRTRRKPRPGDGEGAGGGAGAV